MITLEITANQIEIGKSYWKIQSALLKDDTFIEATRPKIARIIQENDTSDIKRATLLETVLCVLRGEIIQYSARKKRERNERFEAISQQINALTETDQTLSENSAELLASLHAQQDELIETMTQANMFHAKVRWKHLAEKGTAYFHGLVKREWRQNTCRSMFMTHAKSQPDMLSNKKDDMLEECYTFFSKLYEPKAIEPALVNRFCDSVPAITAEQLSGCDREIDINELSSTLFSMKNGSSPGPSGYTAEFYKVFWPELKDLIHGAINEIFVSRALCHRILTVA